MTGQALQLALPERSASEEEPRPGPRPALGLPIASFQRPPQPPALLPIARCEPPQLEPERGVGMVTTPLRRSARRRTRRLHSNTSTKSIPRWALPTSPYQAADECCSPLSLASSLTSASLLVSKTVSKMSKSSFKWTPEALVQSWHGKLSEIYDVLSIIGEGRSGAVFVVQHKRNGRNYACKFLNKRDHEAKTLRAEIQTLRRLDHPNVVRLYETHEDGDAVFLLMELCGGGDLLDTISAQGSLDEEVARVFAQQMLSALAYCHASGVAHRDVKPENFLLEAEGSDCLTVKLADFGVATSIRPEHLSAASSRGGGGRGPANVDEMACGSLPYMAPETFSARFRRMDADAPANMAQLCAADLWSCGVCLYAMLAGRLPFGETAERICSGQPPDFSGPPWDNISEEAIDLIRKLLNPNVRERWTAQQALAHDWLRAASPRGHSSSDGARTPEACAEGTREMAIVVLSGLRRWRQLPKLRRIALAALARRLESRHDAQRLAESAWALFCGTADTLRCEQLVRLLHSSLCEPPSPHGPVMAREASGRFGHHSSPAAPTPASVSTATASPASVDAGRPHGGSITGLHVRQRVRKALRRLATGSPHSGLGGGGGGAAGSSATSLEELRHLVAALDGMKDGAVDYTLFAASLIPADACFDEQRLAEVFSLFDTKKRGFISPGDLKAAVRSGDADLRHYAAMITEFDIDGDGMLDRSEFQAMVQGTTPGELGEAPCS